MPPSALRPVRAVATLVAVALALGGCGADDDAEPTIPTVDFSPAAVISVSPAGLRCAPAAGAADEDCEVGAGSVVEVRNEGPDDARVRGGDVFDSGTMEPGDTMTVVLVDPGELQLETVGPPDATLAVTVTPRAG